MSITVIISHKVKNFDSWKVGFDANASVRASLGIKTKPYRKLDSPNTVYVIGEAPSREVFEKMFFNVDMADVRKAAGVISEPIVTLLEG